MARGPRGPRKRVGAPKQAKPLAHEYTAPEYDEDIDLRDTPEYKRRQAFIRVGTGILLAAFLATSGITCVGSAMAPRAPQEEHTPGVTQDLGSQADRDVSMAREALAKDANNAALKAELAAYLMQRADAAGASAKTEDRSEARKLLEEVVQQDPANHQVLELMARLYLASSEMDKATATYKQVLELSQKPVDPKANDKDTQEAAQLASQVQAHMGLAEIAVSQKKLPEALEHTDTLLKLDPGYGHGYLLRAKINIERKQPEQARRDYEFARDIAANTRDEVLLKEAIIGMAQLEPPAKPGKATTTPAPAAGNVTAPVNATQLPPANVSLPPVNTTIPAPVNSSTP